MWTRNRQTYVDLAAIEGIPDDYLAFMLGHEFGHARYTFPMSCEKASEYSAELLRKGGMKSGTVDQLMRRWISDLLSIATDKPAR